MMTIGQQHQWTENEANVSHHNSLNLNRDTNGTEPMHHLVVSQNYSRLLPPRPLPLITRPFTPVHIHWLLNGIVENDDDSAAGPGLLSSRVPTHLGDDDYIDDDDWTVSTTATTGTASLRNVRPNEDWDEHEHEQLGDSSSSQPPLTIVTFTLPSSAENGSSSNENDDDGDDSFDNEEKGNVHEEGGGVFQFMHEMSSSATEPCGQAYLASVLDNNDEHATNFNHAAQHLIS